MKRISFLFILFISLISCKENNIEDHSLRQKYLSRSSMDNILEISVPEGSIYSFEKALIHLQLEYSQEHTPIFPDWDELEDSMNLVYVKETQGHSFNNDRIIRNFDLLIDNQLPGDYLLNPIKIDFSINGLIVDQIKSDYIPLKVVSSLIEDNRELIDNFNPIEVRNNQVIMYIISFFVFLTTVLIILGIYKLKGKKNNAIEIDLPSYRKRIEELSSENLKYLYSKMNDILREYLDNKLFLSVQSQTTEEFILSTKYSPIIEEWLKVQLYDFMKRSDSVSFGLSTPDKIQIDGDMKFCLDFIDYIENKYSGDLTNDI